LFKFGIELDGKLKKVDSGTLLDSPTGVVRLGAFTELNLTRHFSGKLKAGLNNTYIHPIVRYKIIYNQAAIFPHWINS
ncbi:MAG: hypothetical protein LBH77_06740, partial [Tannerella sp.]|jgi:hypothetical protein|nr:hypothetical protein [Tannerella sp.]